MFDDSVEYLTSNDSAVATETPETGDQDLSGNGPEQVCGPG